MSWCIGTFQAPRRQSSIGLTTPRSARLLLCQGLSGALGQELEASDLPANEVEWQGMLSLSSAHLVTPWLRRAFQARGLISGVPEHVSEFLDAVYALNLESNRRYQGQLAQLIQSLNKMDVRPVLLKGAANLVSDLYPTPGERMIGDIDVLIPPSKLAGAVEHLCVSGYQPVTAEGEYPTAESLQLHHYPPIYSLDWPAPVELHIQPVHLWAGQLLSSEEVIRDATPLHWRGGDCLLPSATHFIMHNVIHAFVVDVKERGFLSLRQLFEFAYAVQRYNQWIDWAAIQHRFDCLGYRSALRGYVVLANACFGVPPALKIGGWSRLRRRFYRIGLEHQSMHLLFSLLLPILRVMQANARNLASTRHTVKNLFTVRGYMRLYQKVLNSYVSVP
jgi:hypothetical protein